MISRPRIAALALASAFVSLPLIMLAPVDIDRAAGLLFLPACWLAFGLKDVETNRGARQVAMLLAAWFGWALLSTVCSLHIAPALVGLSVTVLALATGTAASRIVRAGTDADLRILLGSLALSSVVGLGLVLAHLHAPGGGPANVFSHLRLFGMHQGAGAIVGTAWALLATGRRERWIAALMATAAALGMFWAGGRAPILAAATTGAVWLLIGVTDRTRAATWWAAVFVTGLGLSTLLPKPAADMGWSRALSRTTEADSMSAVTSTRSDFWLVTWRHIQEKPLLGHGAESYRFIRPKQVGEQPHNIALQVAGDYGLAGAALLVAAGGIALWSGLLSASAGSRAATCLATGLLACALFDGVAYHAVTLNAWLMLLGIAMGGGHGRTVPPPENRLWRPVGLVLTVLAGAVLILHGLVFHQLRHGPIPHPNSDKTSLVRMFPTETRGLQRWIDAWIAAGLDQAALEWAVWTQPRADAAAPFHLIAGNLYVKHNLFAEAETEYRAALATTFFTSRPYIQRLLDLSLAAQGKPTTDATDGTGHAPAVP
ncbi:MAG: O-antigen ligase family protein [Verrucomicrobiota bacterium]